MKKGQFIIQIILLYFFLLIYSQVIASDSMPLNTTKNINDTISLYIKNSNKVNVLFFVDDYSCFTCLESMNNLAEELSKDYNANITTFINTNDSFDTINFRKRFQWKSPIVLDILGAYKNYYGVKHLPLMYLTDNSGVIKYIGIPGSNTHYNIEQIYKEAKNIFLEKKDKFYIEGLRFKKKNRLIEKNNRTAILSNIFSGSLLRGSLKYIFSSLNNNSIYVVDSNFVIQKVFKIDDYEISRHILVQGNLSDNEIFFYSIGLNGNGSIFKIDLKNDSCSLIMNCIKNLKENTIPYSSVKRLNDSLYFVNQMNYSDSKASGSEPTIRVYSNQDSLGSGIGKLENIYKQYFLSNYFGTDYCFDVNNNIYEYQNFSDSICYYNRYNKTTEKYYIKFDSNYYNYNWRKYFEGIDQSTDIELRKLIRFEVTTLMFSHALQYDKVKDELLIFYGKNDTKTDKQITYFHRFNKNCLECFKNDVKIPNDCIVIGVNNSIITMLRLIDGISYIVEYKII